MSYGLRAGHRPYPPQKSNAPETRQTHSCFWMVRHMIARMAYGLMAFLAAPAVALAQTDGRAEDGQLGLQPAASPIMERLSDFHTGLLILITLITLLVLALLVYCMVKFRRTANPNPSKVSHNTLIEVIWTGIPVLILVLIAIPSFNLLYFQDRIPQGELFIKVTGYQWYWGYEYPQQDNGPDGIQIDQGFSFDAYMLDEALFEPGNEPARQAAVNTLKEFLGTQEDVDIHRLLDTDTRVVVPVDTVVRLQVTSADVIHNFAVPAFGNKMDAIPGRLNETWFKATRTGTFYGQCSELCGINHAYMPIAIEVVTREQFDAWKNRAVQVYADARPLSDTRLVSDTRLAAAR